MAEIIGEARALGEVHARGRRADDAARERLPRAERRDGRRDDGGLVVVVRLQEAHARRRARAVVAAAAVAVARRRLEALERGGRGAWTLDRVGRAKGSTSRVKRRSRERAPRRAAESERVRRTAGASVGVFFGRARAEIFSRARRIIRRARQKDSYARAEKFK